MLTAERDKQFQRAEKFQKQLQKPIIPPLNLSTESIVSKAAQSKLLDENQYLNRQISQQLKELADMKEENENLIDREKKLKKKLQAQMQKEEEALLHLQKQVGQEKRKQLELHEELERAQQLLERKKKESKQDLQEAQDQIAQLKTLLSQTNMNHTINL